MENTTPEVKTVMVPQHVPAIETKTTFSVANAFKMNTPNWAKLVGDVFMATAVVSLAIGTFVLFAQSQVPPLLPENVAGVIKTIAAWSTGIGLTIKQVANMIGIKIQSPTV